MELLQRSPPILGITPNNFSPPITHLKRNPSAKKLIGHDLFIFDPSTQTTRYRSTTEAIRHRNPTLAIWALLQVIKLILQNFLTVHFLIAPRAASPPNAPPILNLSAFTSLLHNPNTAATQGRVKRLEPTSIKYYKSLILLSIPPTDLLLTSAKWKYFWRLKISFKARTIWYRILHKFIPAVHSDPICIFCTPNSTTAIDTLDHFTFTCPLKHNVWHSVFNQFHPISTRNIDLLILLNRILRLEEPSPSRAQSLSLDQTLACTLQSLWSAHWRSVFDNAVTTSTIITNSTVKAITRLDSILHCDLY
ncbi:hypothetical protein G6F56_002540 [Rhizopus delemar]|uniref:Reverse transcriptase zinc-binding domain-containing protein n=1 Tax=Rhizopus stolonifer TaxID=4846 RepID=A0A367IV31_RHIST|nr:hypothetical protein G6F56_002540 [Rhizopus delemar]RCH81538.1 hypothetical protein CU098_004067 [Rhizopus stolonifer]